MNKIILDPTTKKFIVREKCQGETHLISNQEGPVQFRPPALSEVSGERLGYLAGIIDGDGSICISKANPPSRGYIRYMPMIQVTGSYKPVFYYLGENFGGHMYPKPIRNNKKARKPQWIWRVTGIMACNLAGYLLPYLQIKKRQAELLVKWQSTIKLSHLMVEEDRLNRERIWLEIRELNRKDGRKPNVKPVSWLFEV